MKTIKASSVFIEVSPIAARTGKHCATSCQCKLTIEPIVIGKITDSYRGGGGGGGGANKF